MTRLIIITMLNLALPFLIRAGWLMFFMWLNKRREAQGIKDVTPPKWHFPVTRLLIIGFILLACSLVVLRFWNADTTANDWQTGNQALSKDF